MKVSSLNLSFKKDIRTVFNTNAGKRVLKVLKDTYVETSAIGQTTDHTMYNLGQKELVQYLISSLIEPDDLNEIQVFEYDDDK